MGKFAGRVSIINSSNTVIRALDKRESLVIIFLISHQNHML